MKTHYPFYPKAKGFNNFRLKKYRTRLWKKHTDNPREKQLRISSLISLTIPEHPQKKKLQFYHDCKRDQNPNIKILRNKSKSKLTSKKSPQSLLNKNSKQENNPTKRKARRRWYLLRKNWIRRNRRMPFKIMQKL
jgi:hypothetical protein